MSGLSDTWDRSNFKRWSDEAVRVLGSGAGNQPAQVVDQSMQQEMRDYFSRMVDQRRVEPRDDLISALVAAEVEGDRLNFEEMLRMLFLLLIAGNETTTNLIANAIGYSNEGGRILIGARRGGDFVEFTVEDEGAGIPRDFLPTAFDRFSSRARGEARGGVGLGLSIVKSFVGLHGGTVEIESEEGRGSRVRCRLPLRPGVAAAAAE